MQGKFVIIFFLSIIASISAVAKVEVVKAENVEVHIGHATSKTVSVSNFVVEWGKNKINISNKKMDAFWQNDQIYIRDGEQEIWLPFIEKTPENKSNQYHFKQMNIDFKTEKHFKVDFGTGIVQLKNNYFSLEKFNIFCERKPSSNTLYTLLFCLDDLSSGSLSRISIDESSAILLRKFLVLEPQFRTNTVKANSEIKNSLWRIEENAFRLKSEYEGKDIEVKGTIHYDSNNAQLKIVITEATYFIFSIKKRIYDKLRSLQSRYMSVDKNNVVFIELGEF